MFGHDRTEGRLDDEVRRDLGARIDDLVWEQSRKRAEAIDRLCEMALTGGVCGVAVYTDGGMVDPEVPYGHIYEYQCRFDERKR